MLIEFTVGNHLSFKDKKTLSMEASSIKEFEENTFKARNYRLLKNAAIYGANSSGKSNLIKSLGIMRNIVKKSAQMSSADKFDIEPFLLNSATEEAPSYFEVLAIVDDKRYRYGFEADKTSVHSEWLFECSSKSEGALFFRDKNKIEISKNFAEGKGLEERTRENALFLSVVDQWNGQISKKIANWFDNQFLIFSGLNHEISRDIIKESLFKDAEMNKKIADFMTRLNLGFSEIKVDPNNSDVIITNHKKYDSKGHIIGFNWFNLVRQESSGTNKLFDLSGIILSTLILGTTLIIDELDAKLHPLLTVAITKLFNSTNENPKNAQLIFATHDTNLLSSDVLRRDQIYFTEKNQFEETDLYSLVEYKDNNGVKPRNDRSFEKDYINGRYGAIPFIGDFSNLINNGQVIEN